MPEQPRAGDRVTARDEAASTAPNDDPKSTCRQPAMLSGLKVLVKVRYGCPRPVPTVPTTDSGRGAVCGSPPARPDS